MGPGGRLCFCGNVNAAKAFYQTDDLVNIYNMIAEDPEGWAQRFAERNPVGRIRMNHQEEKAVSYTHLDVYKRQDLFTEQLIDRRLTDQKVRCDPFRT